MQNLIENKTHKNKKDEDGGEEKKKRPIIKSATDLQRLKLEKLMKNPDKPIIIPEQHREKDYMQTVPSFVRNVMGSSAGAGSGEFHVYRHLRRKEYARQKCIQAKSMREQLDDAYQSKLEKNRLEAEAKTAKKRAKRLKKKQRAKKPRTKQNEDEEKRGTSEEKEDDDEESEDAALNEANNEIETDSKAEKEGPHAKAATDKAIEINDTIAEDEGREETCQKSDENDFEQKPTTKVEAETNKAIEIFDTAAEQGSGDDETDQRSNQTDVKQKPTTKEVIDNQEGIATSKADTCESLKNSDSKNDK